MVDLTQGSDGRRRPDEGRYWDGTANEPGQHRIRHVPTGGEGWVGHLVTTIEGEIIPRLMLAHGSGAAERPSARSDNARLDQEEVREFARLIIGPDFSLARAYVDMARARGLGLETIFLNLMAPTARLLGELWKADDCDFTDVTIGLARLQQLLREFAPAFQGALADCSDGRRVLLAPAPGEQHTFGLFMTEEFFRRSGWQVLSEMDCSPGRIGEIVRSEWFSIVGFSLSGERFLSELAVAIDLVRQNSKNQSIGIMVGGQLFLDQPELVTLVGADVSASDARQAVLHAERMLGAVSMRC
ncbi:B12-binding domain-containing protein [Afifella sp. IM 167]|uniref:cobalamin B12-binding domain-containing protein n=1 Tax=Afifella sp. IM 167 TaxID=2033586 RepID=UPI001CCFBBE5|nr:cobalamin B12-binding domain-containing protein [Afifella sp. IM 167]